MEPFEERPKRKRSRPEAGDIQIVPVQEVSRLRCRTRTQRIAEALETSPAIEQLLRQAIEVLRRQGTCYLIVGSLASAAYGRPRPVSRDIDILIDVPGERQILALRDAFPGEAYCFEGDVRRAAKRGGALNVKHRASNKRVNIIIRRGNAWGREYIAWAAKEFTRAQRVPVLPDTDGELASPEDVILGKMWQCGYTERMKPHHLAKHLRDTAAIVQVTAGELDRTYVREWSKRLDVSDIWDVIVSRVAAEV